MRNLNDVIVKMIDALPHHSEILSQKDADTVVSLMNSFHSIQKSIKYSAPEVMSVWWNQVALVINQLPQIYKDLNPWQKKVIDIFTDQES